EDVNYRDLDDDGDGIDTPDEDADGDNDPTNDDTDDDGTPDYLDPIGPDTDDDMASTDEDIPVEVAILDNDTGIPDNGILTTTDPENGTVVINDGGTPDDVRDDTVTYTPDSGFNGTDNFEYTVCDAMENCDTAIVEVVVKEVEEVPIEVNQMVTPNGDGKNDFLFIRGVENARNNTIKIFNRWGVAVYEGFDYNNQNNVFDGRSKGRSTISVQEYLPSGVYFYIFEYQKNSQNNITDSGYIYISK
ncbi:MAG: gliding motility-associated C-terminal domain-containing protein, partial [Maribacter sp.]|nr:gliding motility-associated C-terminal domain-containing protein [Maribacter sp.]